MRYETKDRDGVLAANVPSLLGPTDESYTACDFYIDPRGDANMAGAAVRFYTVQGRGALRTLIQSATVVGTKAQRIEGPRTAGGMFEVEVQPTAQPTAVTSLVLFAFGREGL